MRNRSGERGRVMKNGDLKREKQFRKRLSQEYGLDDDFVKSLLFGMLGVPG